MCGCFSGVHFSVAEVASWSRLVPGADGLCRFRSCVATVIRKQWSDHIGRGCLGGRSRDRRPGPAFRHTTTQFMNPPKACLPGKGASCPLLARVAARSSRAGSEEAHFSAGDVGASVTLPPRVAAREAADQDVDSGCKWARPDDSIGQSQRCAASTLSPPLVLNAIAACGERRRIRFTICSNRSSSASGLRMPPPTTTTSQRR
jgi:hypothetical protein